MTNDSLTDRRLQLLARGYHIIPTRGKVPAIPGWQTQDYLARELQPVGPKGSIADRLARWSRRWPGAHSTGVRVEDGLIVIDVDVDDGLVVDELMRWLSVHAAAVAKLAPLRYGASPHKLALFARAAAGDTAFIRRASHKYDGHQVEVFGGEKLKGERCSRQFVVDGPHSYHDDGSVAAVYSWAEGPALHEVDLEDLPQITRTQISGLIDFFEVLARQAGWQMAATPETDNATMLYDITPESRFDTNKGAVDYAGLCDLHAVYGDWQVRCSTSFMPGHDATKPDKCVAFHSSRHDCVAVYVYGAATTHFPVELGDGYDAEKLAEQLRGLSDDPAEQAPARPDDAAELHEKAAWLVETHAYFAGEDAIIPLHATTLDSRIKPVAFQRLYRPWQIPNPDKRFKRPVYATDLWEASPARLNITGVRMRPDMPFPLYTEAGQLFKNTYRRPRHDATGGDLTPFTAFLERFIPEAREREWLLDWLAHKQARPEIPGTSLFFVADTEEGTRKGTFGTGRGLFFRILHQLYGEQYATAQSFAMLDGSSGQSAFNDWLHGSVLVTVDESRSSPTGYRRGERHAAYEVLKELVDPAPKRHRFNAKHRQAFDGMSYCSFAVATNHGDAVAIPEHDRRFTVLRNGREITPEEATAIVVWTDVPGNIGALSQALAGRDLAGFNMFLPLATAAKAEMAEMALSDVEEMLRDLVDDPGRGLAFTKEHIEITIEHNHSGRGRLWWGDFQAAWHAYCVGLRLPSGGPRRIRVRGTQRKLFCFRDHHRRVAAMPEAAIRREVAKWGGVDPVKGLAEVTGLGQKDE